MPSNIYSTIFMMANKCTTGGSEVTPGVTSHINIINGWKMEDGEEKGEEASATASASAARRGRIKMQLVQICTS
jgi:hypothetical protein